MTEPVGYCTILSSNYLPKAMVLADSLARHHEGARLVVVLTDHASDDTLPVLDGVEVMSTQSLPLTHREVLDLAMGYDLVEFATAVKPLVLRALLERFEQVFYLDPDTYVTSPMEELPGALAATDGGIVLTPHFLHPTPVELGKNEGHLLTVGVYNLGFCGVDRRGRDFLDWWWSHLVDECLYDPLSGLFVDQKWMDIGSVLWRAGALRHTGYNVGVTNLPERPLAWDQARGYHDQVSGEPTRLFHFHAFDASRPDVLSVRFQHDDPSVLGDAAAVTRLCAEYGDQVRAHERTLPPAPPYPYLEDTRGRRISRQLRRAHRLAALDGSPPSPFLDEEADAYDAWRRQAWRGVLRAIGGDVAKAGRVVLPEEYDRVKARFPRAIERVRAVVSDGVGMWR